MNLGVFKFKKHVLKCTEHDSNFDFFLQSNVNASAGSENDGFRNRKLSMRVTTVYFIVEITRKSTIVRWNEMQLKSVRRIPLVGETRAVKLVQCSFNASLFSVYFFYIAFFLLTHWNLEKLWKRSSIGAKSVCKNSHTLYPQSEKFSFHEERSRHEDECAELNIWILWLVR